MCSLTGSTIAPPSENDYELYTPGSVEAVKDASGNVRTLVCQKDGTWTEPKEAAPAPQRPGNTGRVPVQVYEQIPQMTLVGR